VGETSGSRMMEEIPGIPVPMPHWWENFRPYQRQCPTCTPIWLLCPAEDTGGWDGGDTLRLGSRMTLEMINKQQKLLPGYELMCEWKNDNCVGITGQRIVTSSTSSNVNKYVAIGTSGCSGVCRDIASYTPHYNMPMMSWAAGMPDLTDRVVYPNFFRTRIPHTAFTYAWLKVAEICGWTKFAVFIAEEARFRGHFELQLREIEKAGSKTVFQAQILKPNAQADGIMQTVKQGRYRIMQMITYETTWRALMCAALANDMRGLVWLVFGFYNKGWYGILNSPPLEQWSCGKADLRNMGHTAIMATTTMWAPKPELPFYCDLTGQTTTTTFKKEYLKHAADELTSDASVKRGGRDYRVNAPRDAGAQAADGACMYALVLSKLLNLHPDGLKAPSGNTYTLPQLLARSDAVYEDFNQVLQASEFNGVSGSPFRFACDGYPKDGKACDAKCRNSLDCTGDASGSAIVFQFDKAGTEGDSAPFSATSEYPHIFQYNRGQELLAKTQAEKDDAYVWYKGIQFPHGGYWGGDPAKIPAGITRDKCVDGYHHITGTKFCVPDDMMPECKEGEVLSGDFCGACKKYTYYDSTLKQCRKCPLGQMQPLAGQTKCTKCPKGQFSNSSLDECAPCAAGSASDSDGMELCTPCQKGQYAQGTGSTICLSCPRGKYGAISGATNCDSCGPGKSTVEVGSRGETSCVCGKGSYGIGVCSQCTKGMLCDEVGLKQPKQVAGFQVQLTQGSATAGDAIYSVYRCRSEFECLASNALGQCAEGRTGIGCGNCMPNRWKAEEGKCGECDGADVAPMAFAIILFFAILIPVYIYSRIDTTKQSEATFTAALSAGHLIFAVQALSVFGELNISWVEPVRSFLKITNIVAFDLDVLKVQCLFQKDDPATNYLAKLFIFPAFALVVAIMMICMRLMGRTDINLNRYCNSVGLTAMIVYITLTLTMLLPFHCISNPNDTRSMASNPAVLCENSGEYVAMAVLAAIGFVAFAIGFLAIVAWITFRFPALLSAGHGQAVLERYRFIFHRFTPKCYYYGLPYLVRNLLQPLIPVIFPDAAVAQVVLLVMLYLISACAVARLLPWRTYWANISELSVLTGLIVFAVCAAFLMKVDEDVGKDFLGNLLLAVIIITLLVCFTVISCALYRRFVPNKRYGGFLCHHKEAAAALARFFKMVMGQHTGRRIFLDSDQLGELAGICETVRTMTRNVVVLLTKSTLERIWCAGEISTAVRNNISIVLVACDDYVAPDEDKLSKLDNVWSSTQKAALLETGSISTSMIVDAYRQLLSFPVVPYHRFGPVAEMEAAICTVIERCKLTSSLQQLHEGSVTSFSAKQVTPPSKQNGDLVVVGNTSEAESRCTCEILRKMLQTRMQSATVVVVLSLEDAQQHVQSICYLLVLLTKGLLFDSTFQKVLLAFAEQGNFEFVSALADNNFEFPGPTFYTQLQKQGNKALLISAIRRMMNILALPFSPAGSEVIMSAEVAQLAMRFATTAGGDIAKCTTNWKSDVGDQKDQPSPAEPIPGDDGEDALQRAGLKSEDQETPERELTDLVEC